MKKETASLSESHLNESVSRRKLLKILAASGGALAASAALPGKWVKPIVNMGVLPAQAQVLSPPPFRITNFDATEGSIYWNVTWEDGLGLANEENTRLMAWIECLNGSNRLLVANNTFQYYSIPVNDPFGDAFQISSGPCDPGPGVDCGGENRRAVVQLFQNGRSTNQATDVISDGGCGGT